MHEDWRHGVCANKGIPMNDLSKSRPVTRMGLVSYLNDELRRFEQSKPRHCGCRVVGISPQTTSPGSGWQAQFLGNKCEPDCRNFVEGIIGELRCDFEVAG